MHYVLKEWIQTAKGGLSLLSWAVLFLLGLVLIQLFICHSAQATGLQIRLGENGRSLVRFGDLPRPVGLSISYDSIPLLKNNPTVTQKVQVDYANQCVCITEKCGEYRLKKPLFLDLSTYTSASNQLKLEQEWRKNLNTHFVLGGGRSRGLFEWEIPVKFPKVVSRIIGEGGPGLKVSGYRRISFSGRSQWEEGLVNTATSRQSKFPSLNMEQQSSFTITGTIGSKISVRVDQDSRRTTDLENTLQLRYRGEEDEIIKTMEAGNTNLSVGVGSVGYGESKQGLFGIKTTARIGGWDLTLITSQDKGSNQRAEVKAGAVAKREVIRDYDYLRGTFYDLGYAGDFAPGDSITEIRLFKNNEAISRNTALNPAPFGIAYVDPKDTLASYPEGSYLRRFQEIDPNDYFVQRNQYWFQFFSPLGENDILGVYYVVRHAQGSLDTIGSLQDTCTGAEGEICRRLKLIKPDKPKPTDYTWELEWRNVYYLRARNIEREGFRLDIYRGSPGGENINQDKNYQDSTRYLRILGLDQLDLNAQLKPDGIVDYRQIDFGLGYLIFPSRHPFASSANFTGNPGDTLKEKVDSIYYSSSSQARMSDSKYYIHVEFASRSSQLSLGHAPIIEGSDVVTLNGKTLTRGEDYTITYETGEISFINQEALSPASNLTVDYEYAPLLMIEKKSMFGMMAEYGLGSNLKFSTVGIYKSDKTGEQRPRVGQEPIRNFIWGSVLNFSSTLPWLSKMANVLPWAKTEMMSQLSFRGDLAQSVPNPNTINKAFIDDFEGSLEYTDLSVRRGSWTLCSPPPSRELSQRSKLWWYNPYDQVFIKDIWPNKEVERNAEKTNVLELNFFPHQPHRPSNQEFDSISVHRSWNGIMRPLYPGAYDQTRAKFLEIWMHGDKGILHVELGEISEDLNQNKILDTEDKPRNGQRDGILDEDEDLGLDTLNNAQEQQLYGSSESDPSGDDWSYDNRPEKRGDYSKINGTEGNRNDPDRGRRPDTEDINSNSVLDLTNNYFEFTLDLSQSEFLGDLTDSAGWRLYRIPLKDPKNYVKVGTPDWNDIRFARLWVTSDQPTLIKIASIQLVGNRWQNLGISSVTNRQTPLPIGTSPEERFELFVVNTHENPSYYPPPKVAGTLNRQTGVREKEQSLVLKYTNLKPFHQGAVYRTLYNQVEDYTSYRYLRMFVHGPEDQPETAELIFFLRIGTDSSNFYQYHTKVYPGWDDRNEVVMDFDQLTALKAYATSNRPLSAPRPDTTAGPYRVKGDPTLNRIRWFCAGVINVDSINFQPVSGEVWMDEMRVTDVRKEKGISGGVALSGNFADLGNWSFIYRKQDSQYRSLIAKAGSGTNTADYSLDLSAVQLHRLLPVSWLGYTLPLSFNYSRRLALPKWKTGSDIRLPKDLREREKDESATKKLTFSPSFSHQSKNWLWGLTLKRMNHSLIYNTSWSTSLYTPVQRNSSTTITGGYNFPLPKRTSLRPFGWLKSSLIPKSFTQMGFSLLPDNISTSGVIAQTRSHKMSNVGEVTDTYTRYFNGSLNASATPLPSIPLKYSMRTTRDIEDPNTIKYSLIPKQAKLGLETSYGETFSAAYSPKWLAFLNAGFSFDSRYNENSDPLNNRNTQNTRNVNNDNTRSANFTLDWQKLLGGKGKKEEKKPSWLNPIHLWRSLTKRFDPVNVTYRKSQSFTKSGLVGRPILSYRLGFIDDPRVGREGQAQSTDRVGITDDYTIKSGISLLSTRSGVTYSRSISRNVTATDATKSISTRFPDFGVTLNKLGDLKILKKLFTTFTYSFGYSRQINESGSERTGETFGRKTLENFSPLASFTMNWRNRVQTTLKLSRSVTTDQNLKRGSGNPITKDYNNSLGINNSYSFSAPQGVKLPFLRKIKFKSNLGLSLSITSTSRKTESSVGGKAFNVTANNSQLSIALASTYSFSSQVSGGFNARWVDTHDKKTKRKSHIRELGISIQIRF